MPAGRKHNTREIAKRRAQVADMYLKGFLQRQIAEHFGLTQPQISTDLKAIYQEWRNSALRDFDEMKEAELARINVLEQEYWEAWTKSKEASKKESKKYHAVRTPEGETVGRLHERNEEVVERHGDPRYLQGIQWCINKRCEILGLDAPKHQTLDVAQTVDIDIDLKQTLELDLNKKERDLLKGIAVKQISGMSGVSTN